MKKLIKFYAPWCAPCQAMGKVIEESGVQIEIQEVNIDDQPELAAENGVRSIPTLVLLENEAIVKKKSGLMTSEEFKEFVL